LTELSEEYPVAGKVLGANPMGAFLGVTTFSPTPERQGDGMLNFLKDFLVL